MNNPIDTDSFRHYLNFVSLGFAQLYEITEPVGFDVSNFLIRQNDGRFSRDHIFGNEQAPEKYAAGFHEKRPTQQLVHPDGTMSYYLDMGLNWILETRRQFGSEGKIERILEKDGLLFTTGLLDLPNPDTDDATYFACNVIQNTKISNYKKQLTSSIDLLATRNMRNEPITPIPTLKVLRKSVPEANRSEWGNTSPTLLHNFGSATFWALNNNLISSEVRSSLISTIEVIRWNAAYVGSGWRNYTIADYEAGGYVFLEGVNGEAMKLIKSKQKLTDIKVRVRFKGRAYKRNPGYGDMTFNYIVMGNYGDFKGNFDAGNYSKVIDIPLIYNEWVDIDVNTTMTMPFDLELDEFLYGCYTCLQPAAPSFATGCDLEIIENFVEVVGSELALNTVISASRYIDVVKQCSKFINDLPVDAAQFDVGGPHYDNVCWNRALLSMQTNNTLTLLTPATPAGQNIGDVVHNDIDNGIMAVGMYFWNGTLWVFLDPTAIMQVNLVDSFTPAGAFEGDLIFNTDTAVSPNGLCYWNGTAWQSLEYSRPFLTTIQDCYENSMTLETCSDSEIQEGKIFFGEYRDFYTNKEVAAFLNRPAESLKKPFNDRFKVNNIKIDFSTYEQDRFSQNTAEDIHTEAEWAPPNEATEDKFERTINYIRSGFSAQVMVDLETNKPQTAYENDDKVFINSIVPLPPGSFNQFFATLYMSVIGGNVQILNRDSEGTEESVVINWYSLGLAVGDTFEILSGANVGVYTVVSLTNSNIVLAPVSIVPTFTGDVTLSVKFYYSTILWQTETNQRITVISGLSNTDTYPNLAYSIRRIFENWKSYFASMCYKQPTKLIKILQFKNNPKLQTQLGANPILKEKSDVLISDLGDPVLTEDLYDIEVLASFSEILALMNLLKVDRGFVRFLELNDKVVKGYIQELDYTWKTGRLLLKLEEKFEPDVVTLTFASGALTVNDTPYNLNGVSRWWKITGDYFQCFDKDAMAICNIRRYDKVSLNGVVYTSSSDLSDALLLLI